MTSDQKNPSPDQDLAEEAELELYAARGEKPPRARTYVLRIDDEKYRVNALSITGRGIAELANKPPEAYSIEQFTRGKKPRTICPDQKVDLTAAGIERFVTRPGVTFTIDQEECHAPTPTLSVREVLTDYAKVNPNLTTLVELRGDEQVKHPDLTESLPLRQCERFVVFHNTPTPVS